MMLSQVTGGSSRNLSSSPVQAAPGNKQSVRKSKTLPNISMARQLLLDEQDELQGLYAEAQQLYGEPMPSNNNHAVLSSSGVHGSNSNTNGNTHANTFKPHSTKPPHSPNNTHHIQTFNNTDQNNNTNSSSPASPTPSTQAHPYSQQPGDTSPSSRQQFKSTADFARVRVLSKDDTSLPSVYETSAIYEAYSSHIENW